MPCSRSQTNKGGNLKTEPGLGFFHVAVFLGVRVYNAGILCIYYMQKTIETGRENAILRTISPEVTSTTKSQAMKLARELADWVRSNDNAVGLAAPQAGVNLRVIGCAL